MKNRGCIVIGIIFRKLFASGLYRGFLEETAQRCFCLIKKEKAEGIESMPLSEVYRDSSICPTFLFTGEDVQIDTAEEAEKWVVGLEGMLQELGSGARALIWKNSLEDDKNTRMVEISSSGERTMSQLVMRMCGSVSMTLQGGTKINFSKNQDTEELIFGENMYCGLRFDQTEVQIYVASLRISFIGDDSGSLRFNMDIAQTDFVRLFKPSFLFGYAGTGSADGKLMFPLAYTRKGEKTVKIRFNVSVFPSDLFNKTACRIPDFTKGQPQRRTYFRFGSIRSGEKNVCIHTWYQNVYGKTADFYLTGEGLSSGFVLVNSAEDYNMAVSPEGDFEVRLPEGERGEFLCGTEGGERISTAEDEGETDGVGSNVCFWRFAWGLPGYAEQFPLKQLSVTGAPANLDAPALSDAVRTSWVSVIRKKMNYSSVPRGSFYYGDPNIGGDPGLLGADFPVVPIMPEEGVYFPMLPYAEGNADEAFLFEREIIMPVRKREIESGAVSGRNCLSQNGRWIVTPSGQQAFLEGIYFKEILMARSIDENGIEHMLGFKNPEEVLVQAFQTPSLLLIGAAQEHFSGFEYDVCMEEWKCIIRPGHGSRYAGYKNIVVVKGRKGSLYDPDGESLFANPKLWTKKDDFSSPETEEGKGRDKTQQLILSQWLMDYCRNAYSYGKEDEYFGNWNRAVTDPAWQGVLFLNVELDKENLPSSLVPILDGIQDRDSLCFHHIGFTVSPVGQAADWKKVKGRPEGEPAAFFGLIHYQDSALPESEIRTVAPTGHPAYQFRILVLRVRFENSVVKKFESYAQLTINSLFGCVPMASEDGCKDNTMLLEGIYQVKDGISNFLLKNENTGRFCFRGGVLRYADITKAVMDEDGGFSLDGCLAFEEIRRGDKFVDIYSFGGRADEVSDGLVFRNLKVEKASGGREIDYVMSYKNLIFDPALSQPRKGSLYKEFSLDYLGHLVCESGSKNTEYSTLSNNAGLSAPGDTGWFGLRYGLSLGSLGDLADKARIKGELLLAWNTSGNGCAGIKLPGTGDDFLGLQGVLKVSYGEPRLVLNDDNQFLLLLPDISLKLLNVLSVPPSGTTRFFLFGKEGEGDMGWYAAYKKKEKKGGWQDDAGSIDGIV